MGLLGIAWAFAASAVAAQSAEPAPPPAGKKASAEIVFERKDRRPVDFEFVHGLVTFQATVAGRPSWVVLDNGASSSVVDVNFAKAQNLDFAGSLPPLQTATGILHRERVNGVSLDIPHQLKTTAPFSAADLAVSSRTMGRPITMILGRPFTDNLGFLIYASSRKFIVGPSGRLNLPPGTEYAPLLNDLPQVQVDVDGQRVTATLDLGSDAALTFSPSAWTRLGLNKSRQVKGTSVRLDGKSAEIVSTVVGRVKIGPFEAKQVYVQQGPLRPQAGEAVVGMGFLSRFDFFIDEKDRKLWLVSN